MVGIDYASVDENAAPDFAAAASWGVRFVIVRGAYTYGSAIEIDPCVERDRHAINAAGLQFGSYLILGWQADPVAQVAAFVRTYGQPQPGDLPPALDIEFPGENGIAATGLTPAEALAKLDAALAALKATYPTALVYTSGRVWQEDLASIASDAVATCPGWLKVAYPWQPRNRPHTDDVPAEIPLPAPYRTAGAAGAFIEQFQGDAIDVPGFSSTVDLNVFRNYIAGTADPRTSWICARLAAWGHPCDPTNATTVAAAIRTFQGHVGDAVDGVVGIRTWATLCSRPTQPA